MSSQCVPAAAGPVGCAGDPPHHRVCEGDVLARKYAALVAPRSQTARLIDQMGPQNYHQQWWATEAFVAAPAAALEEVA